MSADTRHSQKRKARQVLADLAGLGADAVDLIRKPEARSDEMTARLLRALQLFKEDRLGEIQEISLQHEMTREERFAALSTRLDVPRDGLSTHAMKYCREHGIRYAGEVYTIDFGRGTHAIMDLNAFIIRLGLPEFAALEFDPIAAGWRPPYWDSTAVIDALNESMVEGLNLKMCAELGLASHIRGLESRSCFRVGDFIGDMSRRTSSLRSLERTLIRESFAPIPIEALCHAAMILPDSWRMLVRVKKAVFGELARLYAITENTNRWLTQLRALTTPTSQFVADLPAASTWFERMKNLDFVYCLASKSSWTRVDTQLVDALQVLLRHHHLSLQMSFDTVVMGRLSRASELREVHPEMHIQEVWNRV